MIVSAISNQQSSNHKINFKGIEKPFSIVKSTVLPQYLNDIFIQSEKLSKRQNFLKNIQTRLKRNSIKNHLTQSDIFIDGTKKIGAEIEQFKNLKMAYFYKNSLLKEGVTMRLADSASVRGEAEIAGNLISPKVSFYEDSKLLNTGSVLADEEVYAGGAAQIRGQVVSPRVKMSDSARSLNTSFIRSDELHLNEFALQTGLAVTERFKMADSAHLYSQGMVVCKTLELDPKDIILEGKIFTESCSPELLDKYPKNIKIMPKEFIEQAGKVHNREEFYELLALSI